MMEQFSPVFEGVNDPRKSNATRHDLQEMLRLVADLAQDLEGVIAIKPAPAHAGGKALRGVFLPRRRRALSSKPAGIMCGPSRACPGPRSGGNCQGRIDARQTQKGRMERRFHPGYDTCSQPRPKAIALDAQALALAPH